MEVSIKPKEAKGIDFPERYKVLKKLGEGRFGNVYLVKDLQEGGFFALKESKSPNFTRQLLEEAQNVLLLSHPNLVKLHRYFLSKDRKKVYLLYEYCEGGDLKSYLQNRGKPLDFSTSFGILLQITEGLAYLHGMGYIHLDLKPENVLLCKGNLWKLGDFGLLKTRGYVGILDVKGTVGYIAPEVFKGEIHRSSDIFSLGCLLHFMLTGNHPFKAKDFKDELALNKVGKVGFPPGLPESFRPIFEKMVKINPFLRYRTAGELLKELKKFSEVSGHA